MKEEGLMQEAQKKPLEVLVVDDNQISSDGLKMAFEGLYGANVTTARNGKEAIEIYKSRIDKNPFDAVLTDLVMPEPHDGLYVLANVKIISKAFEQVNGYVPVVIVTGEHSSKKYRDLFNRTSLMQPDFTLLKPFGANILDEIVTKIYLMRNKEKSEVA